MKPLLYSKWVKIKLFTQMTGYTHDAVHGKIKKGTWLDEKHWVKAPDGQIMINWQAIDSWVETGE